MEYSRRFALAIFAAWLLSSLAAAQTFNVTDLGSLDPGGTFDISFGNALNNLGQVAGSSYTSGGEQHAFFWTPTSGLTDLGTFGGQNSQAWGLNDSSQVVGQADLANGLTRAFVWTQAQGKQDLGSLSQASSYAYAINKAGQVVGGAFVSSNTVHAFVWTETGGMQDLGTLGGSSSVATAINDLGEVVGYSGLPGGGETHAFLWTPQRGMQDLGDVRSYDGSYATGINNNSLIAGYSGAVQAFQYTWGILWNNGRSGQRIPFVPGSIEELPMAINDLNQVTGEFADGQGFFNAFLYSKADGIKNLNQAISTSSGWFLSIGTAINRNQQITGSGTVTINGSAVTHAFLLTRVH